MATRRRPDQRSAKATEYRRLYHTARWQARRAHQLQIEPLCRTCRFAGRTTAATIADHVIPHRGDVALFFEGDLQSLCDEAPFRCHSRVKQREETLGFSPAVDASGFPIDPRHPANQDSSFRKLQAFEGGMKSFEKQIPKDRRGL